MDKNIHAGHRERVKAEFLDHGFATNTPPHKILEVLLFFCVRQADTNPLAHALIDRYHGIAGVLDAPVEELITFPGITENNVVLLKMIMPVARAYLNDKESNISAFRNLGEVGDYLRNRYIGINEERLGILTMDGNCRRLSFDFVATGDLSSVGVSTREIIRFVLNSGATCAVMVHNHPGGIALPSGADISMTEMIAAALSHIGVRLLDHVIVADNDYISMVQSRQYAYLFGVGEANGKR